MPGIVGLITKRPRAQAEAELRLMVDTLLHESFYRSGTWVNEDAGVYVGWVARHGAFSDGMPLQSECGEKTLVFSGEDYPEPGTPERLKSRGHAVNGVSASYLVHLSEEEASFPACLNGRFHGLLTDAPQQAVTLFNDRWGIHRIYYHEGREAFYFAAEAKAILRVRPELRVADSRSMGEYVACGCVLENRTLFEGIRVLPPASAWVFGNGALQKRGTYFSPREWEEQEVLEPERYYQLVRETFSKILPRYFAGKEPIGMSVTGGLDTRMIMAWQKCPAGSLPCYSFGGMFRNCQDVSLAQRLARTRGYSHSVIPVGSEFLSRFSHYAERTVYLSDGCVDMTHTPDLYVNERAAQIAPVRMTGNYGGEVLRQVRAFKPMPVSPELFSPELVPHLNHARETYRGLVQGHPLSFAAFRQAPWHHYGLLGLEKTQLTLRSPFLDNEFVKAVYRSPKSALESNEVSLRLINDGDASLSRIRTDRGLAGNMGKLPAAVSRGLLEFSFKAEYAYDYGMPQWVARVDHALMPLHVERLFLGRHKFYHFRLWYRDSLSRYVREILLDSRSLSRPYLQRETLETMVERHLKGDRNYTLEIHKALTLELQHRLFFDRQ